MLVRHHLSGRRAPVKLSGTFTPAQDGQTVLIQRRSRSVTL